MIHPTSGLPILLSFTLERCNMKRPLQIIILLGLAAHLLSADILYDVAVNTSAYAGRSGYLDFQLGSGPDSPLALVAVQNFSANGMLNDAHSQISGDVTGTLPGIVTLANKQQFNDYFAGFTYGDAITFTLQFSGPAVNDAAGAFTYGSPFYFGLYDGAQTPLGSSDAFGNALLVQINTDGTTTPAVYNSAVSLTASAVPEPGALDLIGIGLDLTALIKLAAKAAGSRGQSRHRRLSI
jgi:hypothetical protein